MEATPEYPFVLITGRLMEHFNTGEMSRRSPTLVKKKGESFVEINPSDMAAQALNEGQRVRITSPYGSVNSFIKVSESIPDGYLFAPNHFNKPNYNALMSSSPLDPQARMPALKVVPVSLEALAPKQRLP
jgi:anaerobic selenocysteine-containing dehydrogenase